MRTSESNSNAEYCSMFGAFNLRKGKDIFSFKQAFDAFCEHLCAEGYLRSWRLCKRAYHEGYDSGFPDVEVLLEMCFHDHKTSLVCWDYVEAGSEPMKTLHVEMNRQVHDAIFALYHQME